MCRYDIKDSLLFVIAMLPYIIVSIVGSIKVGLGVWLWAWLAYAGIFFILIEPLVLCRYCPYWDLPGKTLKCHANYGVLKLFKYKPGESTLLEKTLFIITALIFFCIPLCLLIIGKSYLLFAIGSSSLFSFIYVAKNTICTKCINFSCPINSINKETKKQYLEQNKVMKDAYLKK